MPEIRPEPQDIIQQKLTKLKCCLNCQNVANYLIFGQGLHCTQCLSQVKNITPDQLVNFQNLSKILVQLIEEYQKKNKGQVSHPKVIKAQTQKSKTQIKKLRELLNFQIKTLKTKYLQMTNQRYKSCLKQHTLQQLQALYEPDMTATTVMNQKEILLKNLDILQIQQKQGKIEYSFEDKSKNPKQIFKKSTKQFQQIKNALINSTQQVKILLQKFRIETNKQN